MNPACPRCGFTFNRAVCANWHSRQTSGNCFPCVCGNCSSILLLVYETGKGFALLLLDDNPEVEAQIKARPGVWDALVELQRQTTARNQKPS